MQNLFEGWRKFLSEQVRSRPEYSLPISLDDLQNKIKEFIADVKLQPKGGALKSKKAIENLGMVCAPSFGLCFDAATLMQHMAGGKKYSGLQKMRMKKFQYVSPEISKKLGDDADRTHTTHWYTRKVDSDGNKIYDPTGDQFTFGVEPDYSKGTGGDFGTPQYGKKGTPEYDTKYEETVPGKTVLKFAQMFKDWHNDKYGEDTAYGMDWWLEEVKSRNIKF